MTQPRGWPLTSVKGPGRSKLPANDRGENRDRRQRTQAAGFKTGTSVSGEIRLSRQRSTRHLGRTTRCGENAWRPRRGSSARSNQGERHAGSNKPRRRRPFSRGQSRLYTKGIRPPNGAVRNTRARSRLRLERHTSDLPIPQTQIPSAPSSSLCPENAEGQRSRWLVRTYFADLQASLARATTLRRGVQLTECSM